MPDYPLVHIDEIAPVAESGAEVRLAIGVGAGSPAVAYHAVLPAGAAQVERRRDGDEIVILLEGTGTISVDGETAEIRPGHCRLIPQGAAQSFTNTGDGPAVTVGFRLGAPAMDDGGAILVHLDDVAPENMAADDGWLISDFRLPFGRHNGSSTTLFRAKFLPGAVHKKHRHENCAEIYYVISGHGLAGAGDDRVEVRGGHFHYIPAGVEHWLHNLSATEPIEVVGVYLGAGSVADTGYVYLGDVTAADLAARTG